MYGNTQAGKKGCKIKKNKYDVDWFFNNSYVFDLCKNYIELYRSKEVKLYKLKKEYLRG